MIYTILYRYRDAEPIERPKAARVKAANVTRAISSFINDQKSVGNITSKSEIVLLEVRITA